MHTLLIESDMLLQAGSYATRLGQAIQFDPDSSRPLPADIGILLQVCDDRPSPDLAQRKHTAAFHSLWPEVLQSKAAPRSLVPTVCI